MSSADFNHVSSFVKQDDKRWIDWETIPNHIMMRGKAARPIVSQLDGSSCGAIALHVLLRLIQLRPMRGIDEVTVGSTIADMSQIRQYVIDEYVRLFLLAEEQGHLTKDYKLYPESIIGLDS